MQRAALDRFAGASALDALARYRDARTGIRRIDGELEALGGDAKARAREIELLRFQVEEIAGAAIDDHPGRLDSLLDLARRDEAGGLGDAPWPPHFPKAKDEPRRVSPSRARKDPPEE